MNFDTNYADDFASNLGAIDFTDVTPAQYGANALDLNFEILAEGKKLGLLNRAEWKVANKRGEQVAHNLRVHYKKMGFNVSVKTSSWAGGGSTQVTVKNADTAERIEQAEKIAELYNNREFFGQGGYDYYYTDFNQEFGSDRVRIYIPKKVEVAKVEVAKVEVAKVEIAKVEIAKVEIAKVEVSEGFNAELYAGFLKVWDRFNGGSKLKSFRRESFARKFANMFGLDAKHDAFSRWMHSQHGHKSKTKKLGFEIYSTYINEFEKLEPFLNKLVKIFNREIEVPEIEVPATEVTSIEVTSIEVPATEVPATEVTSIEVTSIEVTSIEVTSIEVTEHATKLNLLDIHDAFFKARVRDDVYVCSNDVQEYARIKFGKTLTAVQAYNIATLLEISKDFRNQCTHEQYMKYIASLDALEGIEI